MVILGDLRGVLSMVVLAAGRQVARVRHWGDGRRGRGDGGALHVRDLGRRVSRRRVRVRRAPCGLPPRLRRVRISLLVRRRVVLVHGPRALRRARIAARVSLLTGAWGGVLVVQ